MKEIRIHARAGQGAITTGVILGSAIFAQGRYAYAFPHFGAARMGAPMNAFVRIDDKEIRLRSKVYNPNYLIVVDATLMRDYDVFEGLDENGIAVVNERKGIQIPESTNNQKVYSLPASKIALDIIGKPLANTALLGAFSAATDEFGMEGLEEAIDKRFAGEIAKKNKQAAQKGFDYIKENYKVK
jgi:pyruvate ferredoxin oxidoreductase gamma subunit